LCPTSKRGFTDTQLGGSGWDNENCLFEVKRNGLAAQTSYFVEIHIPSDLPNHIEQQYYRQAFADLDALMTKAKEMVDLANRFAASSKKSK